MNQAPTANSQTSKWQYLFLILLFLSSFIFIKLDVPFTNSGEITFYCVEILGLLMGVFLIFYLFRNFNKLSKENKLLFWTALLSQSAFLVIYLFRTIFIGLEMKSILVFESNLFVLSIYLLVAYGILSSKIVLIACSFFSAIIGIISILLIYFIPESYTDWVIGVYPSFYVLTFGNAVRTHILLLCLPLTALNHYLQSTKWSAICFYLHLASVTACGMISGARVNYICIPLAVVCLSIIFFRFKHTNRWRIPCTIFLTFLFTIALVFISSPFSMRVYTQMMRLDITKEVMTACNIHYLESTAISLPSLSPENSSDLVLQEAIIQAEGSAAESSSSRSHMWQLAIRDILSAPFFGKGLTQYNFTFSNGQVLAMQAHNFVLEYLLSFGLVGFILWIIMIITPEWIILKRIRFRFWNSPPFCFMLCSMAFAICGAFFQPYFLFPCIMFFIFMMIGCYYSLSISKADAE